MDKAQLHVTARCPIRTTLEMLGGKWKLLILFQLQHGPLRLSHLRRQLPDISEKMLVQELKVLADNNLLTRHNFGEVPPRVEYELSVQGRLALPLIEAMKDFAQAYELGAEEESASSGRHV